MNGANRAATGNPGAPGSTAPSATTGGGIRGGGPTTGRRPAVETADRWEFWWDANEDRFLRRRPGVHPTTPATFRAGGGGAAPEPAKLATEEARARILPALLSALSSDEADVVDSAALALARIVPAEQAGLALAPLERTLDHPQRTAREAAALALGVVGSTESAPVLGALLLDAQEGRRLAGRPAGVEEQVRAFAAAALGLIGDPAAIPDLERAVEPATSGSSRSVAQLSLLALGLMRGSQPEIVPFLLRTLRRRELDPIVRAHAPIALANLAVTPEGEAAARSVLGVLVTALEDGEAPVDVRRSAAIALGRLGRIEESETCAALEALVRRGQDGPARQFALIALAEVGARDSQAREHGERHAALEQFLLRELVAPSRASLRPFAALALGIWGRNEALLPDARERAIAKLLEHFDSERSLSNRGAFALALAMLDSRESIAPLARAFAGERDASFKGHVALALGMLGAREHAPLLLSELERPGHSSLYESRLARALGLLQDPRAVPALVGKLSRADTFAEVAAVSQALGQLGDRSAVDPLLALLADEKLPAARRGAAAAALGLLAQKSELPWNAPYLAGSNYLARSAALAEIADIL